MGLRATLRVRMASTRFRLAGDSFVAVDGGTRRPGRTEWEAAGNGAGYRGNRVEGAGDIGLCRRSS